MLCGCRSIYQRIAHKPYGTCGEDGRLRANYRIGASEFAISDVKVIFAAQEHENEQCHSGKCEKMCFGLRLHGVLPKGKRRVLPRAFGVLPSLFSLLIHYCATKTRLRLGFFLWKQKLLLWVVREGAEFTRGFSSY